MNSLIPGPKWYDNLRQKLFASLICLQFVNVLHQNAFIFEDITFGLQI